MFKLKNITQKLKLVGSSRIVGPKRKELPYVKQNQ